jgi:hypothetical protein
MCNLDRYALATLCANIDFHFCNTR